MVKKNKIIFLISKMILLSLIVSINSSWDEEQLYEKFTNQSIVDPNNYFTTGVPEYINIKNTIKMFEKELDIKAFIYIISSMDASFNKNPKLLADKIAYKISGGNLDYDKNTIIILMSISDRKNRIRTGKLVKDLISDTYLKHYLDMIRDDLRSEYYTTAIDKLLTHLFHNIQGTNYSERIWDFIILSSITIFILVAIISAIYKYREERQTKSRLDRIKEITKKNISREAFIDQNCTICLEEFSKEDIEKLKKMQKENSKNEEVIQEEVEKKINEDIKQNLNQFKQETEMINIQQKENEIRNRNIEKEKEKLLNEENILGKNKEETKNFIAKLNCGHIFHSECIDEWMKKKDNCPLCKKRLEDSGNSNTSSKEDSTTNNQNTENNSRSFTGNRSNYRNYSLAEELVDIQTIFYPRMSYYDMNYNQNEFDYSLPPEANSSLYNTSSFDDFASGADAGGASGDW